MFVRSTRKGLSEPMTMDARNRAEAESEIARRMLTSDVRDALVIAHPAHELRVYEWLRRARPVVYLLAAGSRSGLSQERRLASAALIEAAGARVGSLFGDMLDRDIYSNLLLSIHAPLLAWTAVLTDDFVRDEIEVVVVDAWQAYNVAHDLTHLMARIAAENARRITGRPILVAEYPVVTDTAPVGGRREIASLSLSAAEMHRKAALVGAYPGIESEVSQIEDLEGGAHMAVETFREPLPLEELLLQPSTPPHYESFGEARVAAGIYPDVIRWRHVALAVDELLRPTQTRDKTLASAQSMPG